MKLKDYLSAKLSENAEEDPSQDPRYEITKWVKNDLRISSGMYDIRKEGNEYVIDLKSSVAIALDILPLDDENMCYLPFKFGEANSSFTFSQTKHEKLRDLTGSPYMVDGDFNAANCGLDTLKGGPGVVNGEFRIGGNYFTDWDGFPSNIGVINLSSTRIKSFTGISRVVNFCGQIKFNPKEITAGVLELLEIEQLESVDFPDLGSMSMNDKEPYRKLMNIINDHIGENGSHDIFDLQSDLIDAGYESFTKK